MTWDDFASASFLAATIPNHLSAIEPLLISLRQRRGKHLGEVDLRSLHDKPGLLEVAHCTHVRMQSEDSAASTRPAGFISIDSWAEFLDPPESTGIVRASGNWQARLAVAAASPQKEKRKLILPANPCLQCLQSHGDLGKSDVIVA